MSESVGGVGVGVGGGEPDRQPGTPIESQGG